MRSPSQLKSTAGIRQLYDECGEPLLLWLTRRTADPQIALDLWGETFAIAIESAWRFRGRWSEQGRAWLFGIARRQLALYYRHGAAERRAAERLGLELPSMDEDALEALVRRADLAALRVRLAQELDAMPAQARRVLRMRIIDELPYEEVADQLGISQEAARARVSRALKALAQRLTTESEVQPA